MADVYVIKKETLNDIGAAIRSKNGETDVFYSPLEMPDKIRAITTGSGETVETVTGQIVNNAKYFYTYQTELGATKESNSAETTISPVKGSLIYFQYSLVELIQATITISGGLERVSGVGDTSVLFLITGDFTITLDAKS